MIASYEHDFCAGRHIHWTNPQFILDHHELCCTFFRDEISLSVLCDTRGLS